MEYLISATIREKHINIVLQIHLNIFNTMTTKVTKMLSHRRTDD